MCVGKEVYSRLERCAGKVTGGGNRYYPLALCVGLLEELRDEGWTRKAVYELVEPLWHVYADGSMSQAFVEDLLDIICGDYVGMNIEW